MGNIKDIVDLARELESRAKTREDIAIFHRLNEMISNLREQHVEIQERDVQLMRDNEDLRRQLAEQNSDEIRIFSALEFRKGKKTGGKWMAFCPKCHYPVTPDDDERYIICRFCSHTLLHKYSSFDELVRQASTELGN